MRPFPQRTFYFAWLLTLFLLLPACSQDNDLAEDLPGNVVRIDVSCDFGPICPDTNACLGSGYVFPFIYSFLCVPNPDGELEPDLAVRWEYDQKTCTWRIKLRKDALFHNDDPVTAADVAYSISRIIKNYEKSLAQKIKSVKTVDDYLLEIQLEQNDPMFLLSIWDLEIVPDPGRHANLHQDNLPVGSGPFQFEGRTDDGGVILSANENYYRGRPSIDRVIFYYIPDRETSWVRLIKGETDIVGDLGIKDYQIIHKYADRFFFSETPYHYYKIMLYNTRHPLFENPLARRALTHAIDREYIVQNMLGGMAEKVAGPMGNRSPYHDPDLKPLAYDPTLALELLAKAGWTTDPRTQYLMKNGQFFEFEMLLTSGDETDLRVARYIMLCLNDVGIRAHLKTIPPEDLIKHYRQNALFDAMLIELPAQDRRPEEILGMWTQLDAATARAGAFDSPEAAHLSSLILDADDPDTRQSLLRQFDRLIAELQPGTFLFQETYIDAMSKRFTLSYPFSFSHYGFNWLQSARLRNE